METRRLDAEVLIVGGGPAGSAAAIACAQAGLRTCLLERHADAKDKPGEGLHPGVEPLLRELGVAQGLQAASRARFAGVWVGWGGPPRFEAFGEDQDGPWLGYQVSRARLDTALQERAGALGAERRYGSGAQEPIVEQGRVIGLRLEDGTECRSKMLIDASGPARWLARKLDLPQRERSPRQIVRYGYVRGHCPVRDEAPALSADDSGWTWTARVDDDVYQWARMDFEGHSSRDEPPSEFAGMERIGATRGADATWRVTQSAGPGWLLAGDAAANLDPTSSKGVLKALLSGTMAGRTAVAIVQRGADEAQGGAAYRRWIEGWFDTDVTALAAMYAKLGADAFG
ncbi:flavin-dependent dehydrogenase [Panacagrimonas perspica]|uniref:Flavin-dependent dehydrogenase n=1 Tax=Panacagrimonas perspica TaxID=381431 RepID=A0A4S3K421_9GAMM|nr:tryptophan 7-halogenase [Panacagrimonas perspica]TDU25822.1 flavin-dependent dehydrogenase [Panacagrimonas perspica]THD02810.1 hypothetical protein B1810_12885 [Panacagrimonas perspica]